jgi:hypothetical protein
MSVPLGAFDGDPCVRPSWRTYLAYAAPWERSPTMVPKPTRSGGGAEEFALTFIRRATKSG